MKFNLSVIAIVALALGRSLATADTTNVSTPSHSAGLNTAKTSAHPQAADTKEIIPVLAESAKSPSAFQFDIGIPAWSSAIVGTTGIRGVSGQINVPFSSLWSRVDTVVPLTMDARYGKWGFHLDGQYVKLSENFNTRGILFTSGTLTMEQAFANFNLNYRILDTERWKIDSSIGGRYNYLSLGGTLPSRFPAVIPNQSMNGSVSWVDPIIGTNAKVHVYKPLSLLALGDVGGFGVGSHITYQFFGGGEVQIASHFYMDIGYRYLYTNYSESGNTYNVAMKGPELIFGGNF